MCGFAGFVDARRFVPQDEWPLLLDRMAGALRHRGPDDGGRWIEEDGGVGFGFRRLSIIDTSPLGHQPMESHDGRFVVMFNGEIYNFQELRDDLESRGHRFRGHSDTEVMLAAFEQWGVAEATKRFNGMFAYALWDRSDRALYLGRDRIGEKPLYYGWSNGVLLFGSELKGLRAHPAFDGTVDRGAAALFLRFSHVPGPYSIIRGIGKIEPATIVRIAEGQQEVTRYWSLQEVAERAESDPFRGTVGDALQELDALLLDSVRLRMISDVPLGAFLSGGIDSSLIVSAMRRSGAARVRTFSIGFSEREFNEAHHAAAVARHLGTEHTEAYVTPDDALGVIPLLPRIYHEPFADPSQIPTYLVARLARKSVTVSLSGDGGDEFFGGYNRYIWGGSRWRGTRAIPRGIRRMAARTVERVGRDRWDALLGWRLSSPGEKMHKLGRLLRAERPEEMYVMLMTYWHQGAPLASPAEEPPTAFSAPEPRLRTLVHRMMYLDGIAYLPDDLLVKLDRATMAVSLEGRVPLLDPRIIEFAFRLPVRWKIRGTTGKWLLRQLLYRHVPRAIVDRPKMGFGVPIDRWLRGPLRDWAESLLDERRLKQEGYLDAPLIRSRWQQHLAGRGMWQWDLWNVLMFQAWLAESAVATPREPAVAAT